MSTNDDNQNLPSNVIPMSQGVPQPPKNIIYLNPEGSGREADPEKTYGDLWTGLQLAIRLKRLVIFRYKDMWRICEPHALARTRRGYWALSGHWYLGFSETVDIPGWRSFVLHQIEHFKVLQEGFRTPRKGFKPNGGRVFYDVRVAVAAEGGG